MILLFIIDNEQFLAQIKKKFGSEMAKQLI